MLHGYTIMAILCLYEADYVAVLLGSGVAGPWAGNGKGRTD